MQDRTRWLFAAGLVYAVVIRGFVAWFGLFPPGLGYNPELDRIHAGILGWIFAIAELWADLALPALAVYWVCAGFHSQPPAATRAFGLLLLADNVIYIGSTLMMPPADKIGGLTFLLTTMQAPSIAICLNIVARSNAAAKATIRSESDRPAPAPINSPEA